MTTYNTGNPIGSTDSRDRLDNTENMDYLENSTTELTHADRLGTVRKTRHGMEVEHDAQIAAHETEHDNQIAAHESEHDAQMQSFENDFDGRLAGMAFTRVGSFTTGATLTDMRQVLAWEASHGGDGHEYGWTGAFPKIVAAGATPETSGGIGAGAWVDRTVETLRSDINVVVKRFASVADMVADASLTIGQKVEWLGYYQPFDGGGNKGLVVAVGTGTQDGGGYFNLANGQGQIKSEFNKEVDVLKFGATSDNSSDDTASINNAIAYAYTNGINDVVLATKHKISSSVLMLGLVRLKGKGPRISVLTPTGNFKVVSCASPAQLSEFSIDLLALPTYSDTVIEYAMPAGVTLQGAKYTNNVWIWAATHSGNALALIATDDYIAFGAYDINVIGYIGNGIYFDSGTSYIQGNLFTGNITANSAYTPASDSTMWAGNTFLCVVQTASNSGETKNHTINGTVVSELWDVGVNNSLVEFTQNSLLLSSLFSPKASAQRVNGAKGSSALSRNTFVLDGYCRSWDNTSIAQWYDSGAPGNYNALQKGFSEIIENCNGATLSNKFTLSNMSQAATAGGQSGGVLKSGILLTASALNAYMRLGNSGCTLAKNPYLTMRLRHEIKGFSGSLTPSEWFQNTDFDIGLMTSDFATGFILRRVYNPSAPLVPKLYVMFILGGSVVSSAELTNGCNFGTEISLRVSVDQSSITVQGVRCGNTVTKGWYNVFGALAGDYASITIPTATCGINLYHTELLPTIVTRNTTLDSGRLRLIMTKLEFKHTDY